MIINALFMAYKWGLLTGMILQVMSPDHKAGYFWGGALGGIG